MPFIIHKSPTPDRLIHMGRLVEVTPVVATVIQEHHEARRGETISVKMSPNPEPKKRGRPKMADKKLRDESGVDTIHKEDAGKQGPVGQEAQKAPPAEDVKVGEGDKGNE